MSVFARAAGARARRSWGASSGPWHALALGRRGWTLLRPSLVECDVGRGGPPAREDPRLAGSAGGQHAKHASCVWCGVFRRSACQLHSCAGVQRGIIVARSIRALSVAKIFCYYACFIPVKCPQTRASNMCVQISARLVARARALPAYSGTRSTSTRLTHASGLRQRSRHRLRAPTGANER